MDLVELSFEGMTAIVGQEGLPKWRPSPYSYLQRVGVNLDFKEDQLAIEAHVRMRCGWREMDEISEEEYMTYAYEYMEEHPFESGLVVNKFEAVFYDRIGGEFTVWRKIPGVHLYWQPGYFWYGMWASWHGIRQTRRENPSKARLLAEYFGLVEPANKD